MMPHLLISWRSMVLQAMASKSLYQKLEYFQASLSGNFPAR